MNLDGGTFDKDRGAPLTSQMGNGDTDFGCAVANRRLPQLQPRGDLYTLPAAGAAATDNVCHFQGIWRLFMASSKRLLG